MRNPRNNRRRSAKVALPAALLVLLMAVFAAGCGGGGDDSATGSSGGGGSVDLVAYSTPQQAFEEGIIPAFEGTPEGEGASFSTSFGASGDQRRAVEAGQSADVVDFSLEPDMTSLVEAGLVPKDWNANEHKGIITDSVVVISVRPGNPEGIEDWEDLVSGDVEIITPNPATSGGAKWNIMAAYGSQIAAGKSPDEALDFVAEIISNTSVLDDSARDSLQTFANGKGDALIGYENEAIQAKEEGVELEYVIPDDTILIENPAAVTTDAQDPETAKAFLDFIWSKEGQQLFAEYGYRPVDDAVLAEHKEEFPDVPGLFTIEEFGGWEKVDEEMFDDENGKVTEILRNQGAPLE
ncbi:MAG: sulfate ABC transporter substrate-binding protein [Actinomycetota bacterium]|nr:sulfate ABC transporter substrate-binding protein [Actinomycetota bacterium]